MMFWSSKLFLRFVLAAGAFAIFFFLLIGLANRKDRAAKGTESTQPQAGLMRHFDFLLPSKSVRQVLEESQRDALAIYASDHLRLNMSFKDFKEFAYRQRVYKQIFTTYERNYQRIQAEMGEEDMAPIMLKNENGTDTTVLENRYPMMPILWEMEKEMFPWAFVQFPTMLSLKQSYSGRGIILPTGSGHFRFAVHLIRSLRLLKCTLPIWLAYSGPTDLTPDELNYMQAMQVTLFDVSKYVDANSLSLKGWQIKPFAMLMAPFKEVIMMDADIVWMQNPEILFNDPGYLEHHAIIFHDRTLFENDQGKPKWLHENVPAPLSPRLKGTRMYRMLSAHEQESGVIYWNKEHRFHSLLLVCKMNAKKERDEAIYREFYGDKESFWIATEMMKESYTELAFTPGAIGKSMISKKTGELVACGRILQFDRLGWPIWFNGGIVFHKHHPVLRNYLNNFTHYAREGRWEFETECLNVGVTALNASMKHTLSTVGKLFRATIDLKKTPDDDFRTTPEVGLPSAQEIAESGKV